MSDECHGVLKDFANAYNMTMSEVLYECARASIHKMSKDCSYVSHIFKYKQIAPDKRLDKSCYGHKCFACKFSTACRTGVYQGEFELSAQSSALFAGASSKI
tara:strand:- start:104 stop:409 length:306 start_codon:yes stop_codon:yes gene_type:complete